MAEQSSRISHSDTSPYNASNLEKDSHDGQQLPDQQQKETTEAEKNTENAKKRKEMAPRSEVWNHFSKEVNATTVTCNYCKSELACGSKRNGTSSLLKHLTTCKRNPHSNKDDKQPTLQATPNQGDASKCSLTTWRFDQDKLRDALAEMVIVDELPFAFVEKPGFRRFVAKACPRFNVPSRRTVTRDCVRIHYREKVKLKKFFKESCERVCVTTDTWTSSQKQNFMCVTAHFIDNDWVLHKWIIGFFLVRGHKGEDIGKDLEKCLVEWGIDKVFSVTVDNASPNDGAVSYIKRIMNSANASIGRGEYMHMRCAAHILNLIVTNGLKELDISVKRVRAAVKFVKNSPARITKFKKCAELEKLANKGFLSLDVCTRWNSTFLMLKAAATYEKVFVRYEEEDPYFAIELNGDKMPGVPQPEDWDNASKMAEFLEHFYKLTLRVSASNHCTSHIFFHQIADIIVLLRAWCGSGDPLRREMGERMLDKYNKYWADHKSFNILIFAAVALDPRYKLSNYIKIATFEMFGQINGEEVWTKMNTTLTNLFQEYFKLYGPTEQEVQPDDAPSFEEDSNESLMSSLIAKRMRMNDCGISISPSKSELEKYLTEDNEANSSKFNILEWWKVNSSRFPVLSRLARDVLAFPISTVASESAFSTGGRILDEFRSSLTPFMVQALICTQDWLRREIPVNNEENEELLANLEDAILQELSDLSVANAKSGTSAGVHITIDDIES
ncbi:hypothetical protein VPH35_052403 [Triticum aestivum]